MVNRTSDTKVDPSFSPTLNATSPLNSPSRNSPLSCRMDWSYTTPLGENFTKTVTPICIASSSSPESLSLATSDASIWEWDSETETLMKGSIPTYNQCPAPPKKRDSFTRKRMAYLSRISPLPRRVTETSSPQQLMPKLSSRKSSPTMQEISSSSKVLFAPSPQLTGSPRRTSTPQISPFDPFLVL